MSLFPPHATNRSSLPSNSHRARRSEQVGSLHQHHIGTPNRYHHVQHHHPPAPWPPFQHPSPHGLAPPLPQLEQPTALDPHLPTSLLQVGQVISSFPASYAPPFSSLGACHNHLRPPEGAGNQAQHRQDQHLQRSVSHSLSPQTILAEHPSSQEAKRRVTSQVPAAPRNIMMMCASGGTAMLQGMGGPHNIHDPYSFSLGPRSGEMGRPQMGHLVGSSSQLSPRDSRNAPLAHAHRWSEGSKRHLATPSVSSTIHSGTQQKPEPLSVTQNEWDAGKARESEGSSMPVWSGLLTSSAISQSGGGDFGGSFTAGFGGAAPAGRASGRSDGSGGSGHTNGGAGGFGSGEDGSNGDGNDEGGSSASARERERAARKANPLVDLIETETAYVSELSKIIKKVAGAWSRSNFPPAELDTMFRNVESIYRVNRSFLKSLKEIGPNPSSPRALGDLLMRWIDDLETPYLRYCDNYFSDFDNWPSVQTNAKLPPLLQAVSESTQSDGSPVAFSDKKRLPGQVWTLDQLFALPQTRLKYYKKLYARLLKSTQTGRSDHRLLVGANDKLDELLQRAKKRITMSVLDEGPLGTSARQSQESSGADTTGNTLESTPAQRASSATSFSAEVARATSAISKEESPSIVLSPAHSGPEQSLSPPPLLPATELPSRSAGPMSSLAGSVASASSTPRDSQASASDGLESRLDTSRTLDIFSMKPKNCQLRMNPPNIPFTRTLRKSADVVIYFTPSSTGQEVILRRAHIFLLTDLFLVCERMTPSERAERGGDPADMWLLYPPLAGKHLRVTDNGASGNSISVIVLKKETLIVHTESRESKEDWIEQFEQCRQFANNLGLKVKTSSETESGPPVQGSARDLAGTPSLSSAVTATTPQSRADEEDSSTVKDMTRLVDEMLPFSPGETHLDRGDSFNSFVAPTVKEPMQGQENGSRRLMNGSSPAMASAFARSPEPLDPTYPANPYVNNGLPRPPPHSSAGSFGSPQNSVSQPMGFQGSRPGMVFRPPPQASFSKDGLPGIPASTPPAHLVNGMAGNQQRPPRPPPHINGMYSRPPPPRPSMPFNPAMAPPSSSPSGYSNGNGMPRPPPKQEPSRRPSAPDLRFQQGGQEALRRSSDGNGPPGRSRSASSAHSGPPKLPSDYLKQVGSRPKEEYSPPSSPVQRKRGPKSSTVAAQMRCRLYLKQSHAQWKSLGNARIKVYHLMPDDVKQLVVENDKKPTPIISSIILPDGVERVGKVGVAIELSDNGNRTGIVYMIHLRSEESAFALFGQLLEGSDRTVMGAERDAL